jgi:hypothetical protein
MRLFMMPTCADVFQDIVYMSTPIDGTRSARAVLEPYLQALLTKEQQPLWTLFYDQRKAESWPRSSAPPNLIVLENEDEAALAEGGDAAVAAAQLAWRTILSSEGEEPGEFFERDDEDDDEDG